MPLTQIQCKNAKPAEKQYKLFDGKGLYLLVNNRGAKYWRLKYRFGGKEKLLALGVYPEVSLAEARLAVLRARSTLREGVDPGLQRKRVKRSQKVASERSFESIAKQWIEHKSLSWKPTHADKVRKAMERDIYPAIGHLPIESIEAPDVIELVRKIEARGALDVASRDLQRISAVYRYAVQIGVAKSNPASELKGVVKTRKTKHQTALSRRELPELLTAIDQYNGYPPTKFALQLLLLTFVRTIELRGARWDEFDIDNAIWRVPAVRMKMGAEHLVPLSSQALAVLEQIRPFSGHQAMVFPGQQNPRKVMSENTMLYALYRMGFKGRATGHGMRATASSILNEEGFNRDAIERQLAHVERNKVRGAYTHQAEYLEERRTMMQWWGDYLNEQNLYGSFGKEIDSKYLKQ